MPRGSGAMSSATRPSLGRRVAAAGALSALLAVVVGLTLGLVRDPLRLVTVPVLTVGAALAAWTALVHRGARRVVAAAVAASALAGTVVLLLSGSVLRLVV